MDQPRVWDEPAGQRRARAILAGLAADEQQPLELRLAVLAALNELVTDLPPGYVLGVVEPVTPGREGAADLLRQAWALLTGEHPGPVAVRDRLAGARAAAQLWDWVPTATR